MSVQTQSAANHATTAEEQAQEGLRKSHEAIDIGQSLDALAHIGAAITHAVLAIAKLKK